MFCSNITHQFTRFILLGMMIFKATFFLTTPWLFITIIITTPHCCTTEIFKCMFLHSSYRFGNITISPEWNTYPITYFQLCVTCFWMRLGRGYYGQYILGKPANGLGNRAIYQPAASWTIGALSSIYSAMRRNSSAYLNFTLILPPS